MERRPEFTIIAGPNGAGKSRLCPFYVSATSFGFKISLVYFGLYSEEESVSRVIHRVQTGGHDVADDVIRFNFHEGLKNVQQHLRLFDNITFIDGNSEYGQIIALYISKSQTHKVVDNPPLWFREQFEDSFNAL